MDDNVIQRTVIRRQPRRAAAAACQAMLHTLAAPSRNVRVGARLAPDASQQHGPTLVDVPDDPLADILRRAGPRGRQLCKSLTQLRGPLHSLTPVGTKRVCDLVSGLAREGHRLHLTSLDLHHASNVVSNNSLRTICKALPRLQRLSLPSHLSVHPDNLAAALSHLQGLTALHIPFLAAPHLVGVPVAPLQVLASAVLRIVGSLPLLQDLTLPFLLLSATPLSLAAPCLSSLRFHTSSHTSPAPWMSLSQLSLLAEKLPALVALEVAVRSVDDRQCSFKLRAAESLSQLEDLSQLTALRLARFAPAAATTGWLLYQIGSLTNLRSLHLHLQHAGVTPMERGWLAHLTLLTSIDIRYYVPVFPNPHTFTLLHARQDPDPWHLHVAPPSANGGPPPRPAVVVQHPDADSPFCLRALDEIVQAVPHMRALHDLRIAGEYPPEQLLRLFFTQASFQQLASARRTLRSLHLGQAHWNSHAMQTISMLRGLTSLTLDRCLDLGEYSYCALTDLAELRALRYQPKAPGHELPRELVAALTRLEALALRDGGVDPSYLPVLCTSLQRLTGLDVSCEPGWLGQRVAGDAGGCVVGGLGSGVSALRGLARLEVVDLSYAVEATDLGCIRAPASLRRCYLGGNVAPEGRQEARAVMGRHVDVRFERSVFC